MLKKSKILALALVASLLIPTAVLADEASSGKKADPIIGWTIGLPFKLIGAALSSSTGVLVGVPVGLWRGAIRGTKAVAGALGDENGAGETLAGIIFGAAPGAAIHATVGGLEWGAKGFVQGLQKPLEYATVNSAFEGIPDAIEWTAEGASKAFSS